MANELVQGLFQSLLAPQQTQQNDPTAIMAAINSPNPMAAAMAYNLGSTGQVTKGLLGQISGGRLSTATPQEYMQQAVTASPELLQTSAGMQQLAQMAQQAGDRPTALRLSLMSQEKAVEEADKAKQQAIEGRQTMNITNLQNTMANMAVQRGRPDIADAVKASTDAKAITDMAKPLFENGGQLTPNQIGLLQKDFTPESVQAFARSPNTVALVPRPATQTAQEMTPYQQAQLYSKFTSESVAAHLKNPTTPLIPLPAQGDDRRSAHAQRLVEEGLVPGTPTFQFRMNEYNKNAANLTAKTLSPIEQVAILNNEIRNSSTHQRTEEDIATVRRIQDTLPLLDGTNPQAFTVVSASIPMLYQTNARAASEIDSFRSRKSITSSIGDWVVLAAGDTATKETKDNLKELVTILDKSLTAQYAKEVDSVRRGYTGMVDQQLLDTWYSNQLMDFTADTESLVDSYLE